VNDALPPPDVPAPHPRRLAWSELLRRAFAADVLDSPRCAGRIRLVAAIHPPDATHSILECLNLPSRASPNIDAWLKGHVAMVVPILFALRRHEGDNQALARDRATLRLMANAVREGLTALQSLGYPIKPFRLKTIIWLPLFITVAIFGKIVGSDFAKVAFVGHAKTAAAEFDLLIHEFRALIAESRLPTPALDELCAPRA